MCSDPDWRYTDTCRGGTNYSCAEFVATPGLGAASCDAPWAVGTNSTGDSVAAHAACEASCPATATRSRTCVGGQTVLIRDRNIRSALAECEAESASFDCPISQATYGRIEDWDVSAVTSFNNWGNGCTETHEWKCGGASPPLVLLASGTAVLTYLCAHSVLPEQL